MNQTTLYCGIDVSCDTLDICNRASELVLQHAKLPNTVKGFMQLLRLTAMAYQFVPATGVYRYSASSDHPISPTFENKTSFNQSFCCSTIGQIR